MEEKILTVHALGKSGVNISKDKYDLVLQAIEESLNEEESMTFNGLRDAETRELESRFEGSISLYYTTVKLDLDARGVVERVPGASPQRLLLTRSDLS